jgi:isopentenyl-diphosphate delta-isomerase type 1
VAMGKGDFRGREALAARKEAGPKRLLVGLRSEDRLIPRHGMAVHDGDRPVGEVTSGTFSPTLRQGIALAYVLPDVAAKDTRLQVDVRGRRGDVSGGRLLVTRRALGKRTWPGVWTNSCCGHPGPGEDPAAAATRRLGQELGLRPDRLELVLPDFTYRAVAADGIVEHEVCPVFFAHLDGPPEPPPAPDPEEVADWRWVPWAGRGRDRPLGVEPVGGRAGGRPARLIDRNADRTDRV